MMASTAMEVRQSPSWQFSLKSLLFVTTLVAVCAAIVHIALALAIVAIPLIAAALVRTIRVTAQWRVDRNFVARPKLFATFCYSIFLIVAMIVMCLAATALAGVAAALIATTVIRRVIAKVGKLVRPIATRAWQLLLAVWNARREIVSGLRPGAVLDWLQLWAVVGTLSLISVSRLLFRQCWCCPSRAALVSSEGHSTTRTVPL